MVVPEAVDGEFALAFHRPVSGQKKTNDRDCHLQLANCQNCGEQGRYWGICESCGEPVTKKSENPSLYIKIAGIILFIILDVINIGSVLFGWPMTFEKTERFQNGFFHRLALLHADRPPFGLAFASAIFSAMSTRS